ncbi:SAM pointed domain-containing Ets transcription factor-like isoform X1 [Sphaeramia orbicularis]|uniref:SAM pointed domain-containing Ets transcription factor-like isoform X1 n=2 Tax=Sphaeramia orbicularis TaxID=375764 RepID=UPI00117D729F|nr:SAM pointed domain-containing Ets transcription factor-like isoform X1 [Sphaeramia orbicularis]
MFLFFSGLNTLRMESPGYEHMLYSTHPPLYISQPNPDTRMACSLKEEDIKPTCSLLEINEHNWSGVYMPYYDRLTIEENPWLLRMTEVPAPAPPPFRTVDLSPPAPTQTQDPHSEMESQAEERCLEQVHTMVVGEVLKDIDTACKLLNIAPDPMDWTCMHVQKWLLWTEHLYRLPQISMVFQELTGSNLCSMTEADFRQRTSQFGDMLYAHLDIWRSAAAMKERCPTENGKSGDDDSWSDVVCNYPSQPIHLWQFLRDLLRKPHNYSRCIRWLNKEKGIFKIEDSAHVARLWGIRKNRPAMNYDKLSRSIRQYYKKGIIRKPDVSGRLVYQFVHPVW